MANNIAITTTIEEQLFEDIKKTHDENNVSFIDYQQKHNKLLLFLFPPIFKFYLHYVVDELFEIGSILLFSLLFQVDL